ncbi:MAG: ATP-binding protein [Chloroflexota bacterium]|nr:HAMP domain-containing protein [Chloroflexota bacterium]
MPLSKANWGVVIRQSEDEALAPTRELRQNLILFGIVLVTVALLFVVITTRDVGSRIRLLTVASKKIAEGDLDGQVANLGRDEVGVLSQTLDDMRRKLKTSYGELKQKTQELSSLLSVSEILSSAIDLSPVLDAVVVKAVEVVPNADGGLLLLDSDAHGALVLRCIIGMNKDAFPDINTAPGSAPGSDLVSKSEGEATKETSAVEEAIDTFLRSEPFQSKAQSFICGKVFERNRVIGGLVLVNFNDKEVFSESDYRLLQAIADGIGITIERAQLANEAEEARALHEADRLRSQFISSVSHELRTPLTLIKGYSTSLLRKDASWERETQREFLQIIDEKTDELRDLIDKILQSAKLEAGAVKLEKEPLLIPRLAEKVVEEISTRAKKHEFDLSFAPSFPVVEADVRCIEQVLRNLLENAVKYSPDGGVAKISGKVIRDRVIVEIKDNGTGIPQEYHDKIFERFYRVDSNLTRGTTGSGLGLSIVKAHVEAHGGEVWFKSAVGKGSTFYFSLPLSEGYEED